MPPPITTTSADSGRIGLLGILSIGRDIVSFLA
jgi:hypothetical protein